MMSVSSRPSFVQQLGNYVPLIRSCYQIIDVLYTSLVQTLLQSSPFRVASVQPLIHEDKVRVYYTYDFSTRVLLAQSLSLSHDDDASSSSSAVPALVSHPDVRRTSLSDPNATGRVEYMYWVDFAFTIESQFVQRQPKLQLCLKAFQCQSLSNTGNGIVNQTFGATVSNKTIPDKWGVTVSVAETSPFVFQAKCVIPTEHMESFCVRCGLPDVSSASTGSKLATETSVEVSKSRQRHVDDSFSIPLSIAIPSSHPISGDPIHPSNEEMQTAGSTFSSLLFVHRKTNHFFPDQCTITMEVHI